MESLLQVGDGEAGGACAGDELGDELGELALAIRGCLFRLIASDEGAGALLGVEDAAELHLAVGAATVWVDGEIDGDAADGGSWSEILSVPEATATCT